MKTIYTTFILSLMTCLCVAQGSVLGPPPPNPPPGYYFGIVHHSNYDFKIVAIPVLDDTDTDISDIGFTLMLPAGIADIVNESGLLGGRVWTVQQFDAAFLTGQGLGDGTRDAFQFNLPAGQTIVSHTAGQQIDLVSFQVSNSPVTGVMSFLLNSDPIATGAGGVLDSFYNSNINASTTIDYFSGFAAGMELFMFSTLSIDDFELLNGLSVYPNPTSNYINIESNLELNKVSLYDSLGKMVLESLQTKLVDVSQLSSGLYFVNVYTEDGKRAVKKIIIER